MQNRQEGKMDPNNKSIYIHQSKEKCIRYNQQLQIVDKMTNGKRPLLNLT